MQCATLTGRDRERREEKEKRETSFLPWSTHLLPFQSRGPLTATEVGACRLITRHCFSGFLLTQILAQRLAAFTVSTTHGRRPPVKVSTYGCPGSEPASHKLHRAKATKPAEPPRSDSYTSAPTGGGPGRGGPGGGRGRGSVELGTEGLSQLKEKTSNSSLTEAALKLLRGKEKTIGQKIIE